MKAKAPEKIYIQSFNISEEVANFDKSKMFFDDVWTEEPELGQENIEYTRTDAFIEKACKYFHSRLEDTKVTDDYRDRLVRGISASYTSLEEFIEDFKDYMGRETNGV